MEYLNKECVKISTICDEQLLKFFLSNASSLRGIYNVHICRGRNSAQLTIYQSINWCCSAVCSSGTLLIVSYTMSFAMYQNDLVRLKASCYPQGETAWSCCLSRLIKIRTIIAIYLYVYFFLLCPLMIIIKETIYP